MNRSRERGAAAVELVLITPVLVGLMLFVVGLGRLSSANGEIQSAARDAARAAANERSPATARQSGTDTATAALQEHGVECRELVVTVDSSQFRADGFVTASVTCTVDLHDVLAAGFPGSKTLTADFTAPVDRYRGVEQ